MTYLSALLRLSIARPLLLASALLFSAVAQAAPTGLLNDTGQTQCADASDALVACDNATTGNAGTRPRQDGRFGRDVANPTKVGGGAAGFDFTKVCMNGTVNCTGAANTGASPSANEWACTKDNVTNLIWSLQTQTATWNAASAGTYPDAGHNSTTRCGFNSGWRLPTRRELLSIVHRGLTDYSTAMIDVNYFPATQADWYWTADTYAPDPSDAWFVYFGFGDTYAISKTNSFYVRLVRSGQ
jgi:hypothetical protein